MIRIAALSMLILPAASQAEDGKAAFKLHCSTCHGTEADKKSTLPTARNLWTESLVNQPETEAGVIEMINVGNIAKGMAPLKHLPEETKSSIASYIIAYRKANGVGVKAENSDTESAESAESSESDTSVAAAPSAKETPKAETKSPAKPKSISIEAAMAAELQESKEGPLNVYTKLGLVDGLDVYGLPAVPAPVPAVSPEAMPEGDESEATEDAEGGE